MVKVDENHKKLDIIEKYDRLDAAAKSPKNAAKTTATLQNRVGEVLLTLASDWRKVDGYRRI